MSAGSDRLRNGTGSLHTGAARIGAHLRRCAVAMLGATFVIAPMSAPQVEGRQLAETLVPVTGHWTSGVDDGPSMTVDGTKWGGTTDSLALVQLSTQLFGSANASFVANGRAAGAFPLAVATGVRQFTTGTLRVRFKLLGGASDQNAGIMFGLQPNGEYFYLRYNTKDGDLALWAFANGARRVIAHGDAKSQLPLNTWQVLEVTITGRELTAGVQSDSTLRFVQSMDAVPTGRVGVWVKRDAVTSFQRFEAEPASAR